MTTNCERTLRPTDLSLAAGRKRQSPRTGFVHTFRGNDEARDVIPIYENGCFVLALFAQKKAESIIEGKDLLSRLLAFQTEEGNFPTYLHDFPRCYDAHLGLKMAPLLLLLLREFESVLGAEIKQKIETSLQKILAHVSQRRSERPLAPLWEFRYQVCSGAAPSKTLDTSRFSPADWWEYWVSLQFLETPSCSFFHPELNAYIGPSYGDAQDQFEPAPVLLKWMAPNQCLIQDHPLQLSLSALQTLEFQPEHQNPDFAMTFAAHSDANSTFEHVVRLLWGKNPLHSLVLPITSAATVSSGWETTVQLPPAIPEDLFEIALYCDARLELTIDGKKGTVFFLGQKISLGPFFLTFEAVQGEGDFCGHILRGNRPCQLANTGAYDWKIGLRTLRRSEDAAIKIRITL